jgi:hypothetical protein
MEMLLNEREKNNLMGDCEVIVLSFLLTTDCENGVNFSEGDGAFDDGRPCSVPNVRMEEHILEFINKLPDISNRGLAPRTDTYSAPYITTQQMYIPSAVLQQSSVNSQFTAKVLFTNESMLHQDCDHQHGYITL